MAREIKLLVNDKPIPLDYFVQGFINHTVKGMLSSLEGTSDSTISSVDVKIDGTNVAVIINNTPLPINAFVTKVIRNTLTGMLSSLKGVTEINQVMLNIKG